MCLKVWDNIFRRSFQGIAVLAAMAVIAGCSSGTQRFGNIFSHHALSPRSNISANMPMDSRVLSYGGMIQSTELPSVESDDGSWEDSDTAYSPSQQAEVSSDSRIMGTPPRNLGTLSRSQMDNSPILRRNSYIVQSGDTLLSIARQVGVSVETLKQVNGISNNSIYIGQVLVIPTRRSIAAAKTYNGDWAVSKKETSPQSQVVSSIKHKKTPAVTTSSSIKTSKSTLDNHSYGEMKRLDHGSGLSNTKSMKSTDNIVTPQSTGIARMRWPVRGRLLSYFGQKKGMITNRGIDIAVPEGSSVKAAENGIVIYASDGLKELGNVVMIRHEDNVITIYGCNSKLSVNKGQRVQRGDEIAKSGVSGNVKTPRVYFEVRKNSLPVDPIKYLEN
ncbi:murein DD-endopeptidase MepM/ murein hydrolase activator NlpD [Bartonella silvatica]|uniref:Murein DD-endopeptidase MepM/ murein hydrolase activator NlpD n=1 Tax=Bartonella silvatica TaxID=357760 RepID=A0ABV2HHI6_9HYPH